MKILISTPLFPPESHYPAHFSKKFSEKLGAHDVSILAYSNFPESSTGKIINISKNKNIANILVNFLKRSIKPIGDADVVVLHQAGFFSFLSFLLGKQMSKKIITKIKEDEVGERKRQFGKSENNFKLGLINRMQGHILKNSDSIFFDSEDLKKNLGKRYSLDESKSVVLKQPEKKDIFPFANEVEMRQVEEKEWEKYIDSFLTHLKKYEE